MVLEGKHMHADFKPVRVLGLMSGTSFDGVDAAVLETDGEGAISFGETGFEAYSDAERSLLRAALGKWPEDDLDAAHDVVLAAHHRLADRLKADLIGFHGQTLAHDPGRGRTHQLGDGAAFARLMSRDVVWDFRSADMKAGGQGAPLAPFYHHALARRAGLSEPVVFLNLGGVANVTWVDPRVARPEEKGALLAFDTGPANALLDDFLSARSGLAFDEGGGLAASGDVQEAVIDAVDQLTYLQRPAPKSLDRDDLAHVLDALGPCAVPDGAATLTAVTARCVGRSVAHMSQKPKRWFACGGGRHNETMMDMISAEVGAKIAPVEALGFDGDMIEAQAFAWLAVRVVRGLPLSAPSTTGVSHPMTGGQIARSKALY